MRGRYRFSQSKSCPKDIRIILFYEGTLFDIKKKILFLVQPKVYYFEKHAKTVKKMILDSFWI